MGAVSASSQSFPKHKVDSDVEKVICYLHSEHQRLQCLLPARLWGRMGWKSIGGAIPGEGDWSLSGQGCQCSCHAVFSRMTRGATVWAAGEEVRVSLLLLRNVTHWLTLLLVEKMDAQIKLNKGFKGQQKHLGYSSSW